MIATLPLLDFFPENLGGNEATCSYYLIFSTTYEIT